MLFYIIRLDDACPTMNSDNWIKVENILDSHNIKPIVGIIPDSKDSTFLFEKDTEFWQNTAIRYRDKGWVIAQHGCHHVYQKSVKSEFSGLSYDEQKELIEKGYNILLGHDIIPTCFFAPSHMFDDVTIDVCRDSGYFTFISDGKSLFPYKYKNMLFIPSLFDSPHKIFPVGIFTFVLHPNTMTSRNYEALDEFCTKNKKRFAHVEDILKYINTDRKRGLFDIVVEKSINILKNIKNRG